VLIGRNGTGKSTVLEALQWIDQTLRRDAREACDKYFGIADLINLRSQTKNQFFELEFYWGAKDTEHDLRYLVRVTNREGVPQITNEELVGLGKGLIFIQTIPGKDSERAIYPDGKTNPDAARLSFREPDRLALAQTASMALNGYGGPSQTSIRNFWARAVFLRLSPRRLAQGSPATRKSFDPLLDEEGQNLPALINELGPQQRRDLVEAMTEILPGVRGIEVSKVESIRSANVHYNLLERMPYRGRAGKSQFPIPAWMLSEGTRRITALLALLFSNPLPSLLCIEEIENGLDPWTVIKLLQHLKSAADRGVQVILTTHSPWILDHVALEEIIQVRRTDGDTSYERFSDREAVKMFADSVPPGTRYVESP